MRMIAELTLPGVERSVPEVRAFVGDVLATGYVEPDGELFHDMVLVVDELAGNAIRHTDSGRGGKVTVALLAEPGRLRVEVVDDGGGGVPVVRDAPDEESGRGLHIVDALAERWGHGVLETRTVVWAEFTTRWRG